MKSFLSLGCLLLSAILCTSLSAGDAPVHPRRFFSDDSFWNQKIPDNPEIDPRSEEWIAILKTDPSGKNFGININKYTIPVYRVTSETPTAVIAEASPRWGQSPGFSGAPVPIPERFEPSPGTDQHLTMVDYERGLIWDMWHVTKDENGNWVSNTGMIYELDGPGVFDPDQFPIKVNQSIHEYGPGRAAGVPVLAGTIMYDEVQSGTIQHRLAGAVRFVAYQEYVYPPAIWTDGNYGGGIPEGAILQLDPELDLNQFGLTDEEKTVARALQQYGMVIVDFAGGNALYAEGLWYDESRTWDGQLRDWDAGIADIPLEHYRVLKTGTTRKGGDRIKLFFMQHIHPNANTEGFPDWW